MVLHESQNEQTVQNWFSRSAQERRDLSASVEETLVAPGRGQLRWSEETDQQSPSPTPGEKSLFPPRLSLQSMPLPAVRSGGFVENAVRSRPAGSPDEEDELSSGSQNTNVLARFAQRLTSSFAALGTSKHGERVAPPPAPPLPAQEEPSSSHARLLASPSQPLPVHAQYNTDALTSVKRSADPVSKAGAEGTTNPSLPAQEPARGTSVVQSKQRLAGRATKIRLETAPIPATPVSIVRQIGPTEAERVQEVHTDAMPFAGKQHDQIAAQGHGSTLSPGHGEDEAADVYLAGTLASSTSTSLPVVGTPRKGETDVKPPQPPQDELTGEIAGFARGTLSGSGVFEVGQGDVTIANEHISASSVVLVTLTAKPGPVVVQYVSLQPRVGFTVHLSAPARLRAPFNYIVLLGELF